MKQLLLSCCVLFNAAGLTAAAVAPPIPPPPLISWRPRRLIFRPYSLHRRPEILWCSRPN